MTASIKTFEVQLDLDNCNSLYDSIREERYERPGTGWDLLSIITRAKRSPKEVRRSRTAAAFQLRLAVAHIDKGFFEKQKQTPKGESQSILSNVFSSELRQPSLPFWLMPTFEPGDIIKGNVALELTDPMEAVNVKLEVFGAARTRIRVHTGRGSRDLHGREDYIRVKHLLWLRNGSKADKDATQSASMMTGDALTAGYMQFPFEFRIPMNARPTVPPLVDGYANYAHISYFMKASISKGKLLRRGNVVCNRPLLVDKPEDLSRNPRSLTSTQIKQTKKVGFFNANNIITCTVSLPKKAYCRGEGIQVSVEIDNQSSTVINNIMSRVEIFGTYRSSTRCCQTARKFLHRGVECKSGAVSSGMSPHFRLDTPQKFATIDGALVPACPLENCGIIKVAYQVHVEVQIKGMHFNMHIRIPIEVATKNSSQFLPGADDPINA